MVIAQYSCSLNLRVLNIDWWWWVFSIAKAFACVVLKKPGKISLWIGLRLLFFDILKLSIRLNGDCSFRC
jgi:hypothetical protein